MLGQSAIGRSNTSPSSNRLFVYEVQGLRQNEETDRNNYQFRKSGSVFIKVPYNRMNEEMQRLSRMGATIVSIKPCDGQAESNGD